jgi:hypothetical protein
MTVVNDRVRVVIDRSGIAAEIEDAIQRIGGLVEAAYLDKIQALLPVAGIATLANIPSIRHIAKPLTGYAEAVADEAVAITNASIWHAAGWTGAGIKVGVVDNGFIGYQTRQASGDLPGSVTTADFGCGGISVITDHGTAVAEIVHKMAPDAQLYLICVGTSVNLGQAKDYAISQGIRVINHSVSWFNSSRGDGSGGPSSPDGIVADARANGILWVNAAGNRAQQHWSGVFADANSNFFHDFATGDEVNDFVLGAGSNVCVYLKWDSWPVTSQDYDLYLFRSADLTTPVAWSTGFQNGSQPPTEALCYTNTTGLTQSFGVAIDRFSANLSPRFDLFVVAALPQYVVAAGSITEPGSSPSTMAAGAICFQDEALQPYSGRGPTIDGRVKPDISGQDATSSSVYGGASGCTGGFLGTSAAAPHVAGAAVLVAQANPAYAPSQLQAFLEGRAVDLGTAGKDSQYGSGRLSLGALPAPVVSGITPSSGPGVGGTTVTLSGNGFNTTSGGTVVRFGTTAASSVGCATAQTCTAVSPSGVGAVHVTATVGAATSAISSSDVFTYIGAVGPGTYEDTNSAVSFTGTWTSWADAAHSGGSVKHNNQSGSTVGLTYTGSSLTLVVVKQFNTGIATVTIDGSVVDSFDTYSATQAFQQQKTYTTAAGTHTVSVAVSGTKNAAASDTYIVFDAFIVGNAPAAVGPGTYEDTNSAVSFTGTWTSWADAAHSGGSAKYSKEPTTDARLTYSGTSVTLVYVAQYNTGIALVIIDGDIVDHLDTYSAAQAFQHQKTYATAAGIHTISVAVAGTKNPSATDLYVVFDAFIVGP